MLVTLDDLEDRRRYLNITATLDRLLGAGAVPVINENDSVATEEIRFGDNDRLAARVAQAAGAQGVVLLSDVDGLYDRDPEDPEAQLISEVAKIDGRIRIMVRSASSAMGSGGMASKLDAADIATRAGIGLAIASGLRDHPLAALDARRAVNLVCPARWRQCAQRAGSAGGCRSKADRRSMQAQQKPCAAGQACCLLARLRCVGDFRRGDVIDIVTADGETLARGLSEYNAIDAARFAAKKQRTGRYSGTVPRSGAGPPGPDGFAVSDSKTVALTGATGFVGNATLDRLLEAGWHVRALTRSDQPKRGGRDLGQRRA